MNRFTLIAALVVTLLLPCAQSWGEDFAVHGQVTDVNGRPVAGAEVALYRSKNVKKPADFASNRTTDDGAYTVTVPAGKYFAVAVLRKGEKRFGPLDLGDKHSGEAVEVEVGPGVELKHDFTVMDLREAAKQNQKKNTDLLRLAGRIVDQDGKPVAMAYVMADKGQHFKEMPAYLSAWTDSSGGYLLLVPKGTLFLGAANKYPPDPAQALGKEVAVTADTEGIDFVIQTKTESKPESDDSHAD